MFYFCQIKYTVCRDMLFSIHKNSAEIQVSDSPPLNLGQAGSPNPAGPAHEHLYQSCSVSSCDQSNEAVGRVGGGGAFKARLQQPHPLHPPHFTPRAHRRDPDLRRAPPLGPLLRRVRDRWTHPPPLAPRPPRLRRPSR